MSADHNISDASLLLMLLDSKFGINFKNNTENATILNVVFLFIQNTLYKTRPYLGNRFTIDTFFLFSVSHIFSVIVTTNSDSSSASQYRVFLYLTRKHIFKISRYFWNGILISDCVSGRKIMKKNQVHFYIF